MDGGPSPARTSRATLDGPMTPPRPRRGAEQEALLPVVYEALGALFQDATCLRSTRCCRFRQTGRVPYVWPMEARRVLKGVGRRGGRLPRQGGPGDCPLLLEDGACSVYEDRPFGCRTFFCRDATLPQGPRRREVDALAMQLRGASEALGERELVPLTTALEPYFDKEGRRRR